MGNKRTIYTMKRVDKRPRSPTTLQVWLSKRDLSRFAFAKEVGCDPRLVALWADGRVLPGLIYAFKIERATKGGVPVTSWLGTELGRTLWNSQGSDWENLRKQRKAERARNWKRQAGAK